MLRIFADTACELEAIEDPIGRRDGSCRLSSIPRRLEDDSVCGSWSGSKTVDSVEIEEASEVVFCVRPLNLKTRGERKKVLILAATLAT